LEHLVEDHLPGGSYDNYGDCLSEETASVPKANTASKRDYAQLDHLLQEKPNATIISLEAMILFNNIQTSNWLNQKEPSVRAKLLANVRKCGVEFKKSIKFANVRCLKIEMKF